MVFSNHKLVTKASNIRQFQTNEPNHLYCKLVAVNAIAVQYIWSTDPSCTSDGQTAFGNF